VGVSGQIFTVPELAGKLKT